VVEGGKYAGVSSGLHRPTFTKLTMPSRVVQSNAHDDEASLKTTTPPSESEISFVSAESENTSDKAPCISAPSSPPPTDKTERPSSLPRESNPRQNGHTKKRQLASPPSSQAQSSPLSPPAGSYFAPQPGASGLDARSPFNKRPPASRSSHGIETRSGPPPALSTQRSYNADVPWRSQPQTDSTTKKYLSNGDETIDSILRSSNSTADEGTDSEHLRLVNGAPRRSSLTRGNLDSMASRLQTHERFVEDQDPTIRMSSQSLAESSHPPDRQEGRQPQASQEDLFLNLARADSVVDVGEDTMSRRERRRVSTTVL